MNHTPKTISGTIFMATRAARGARAASERLQLAACTPEAIAADLFDLDGNPGDAAATPPIAPVSGKQAIYLQARTDHARVRAARRETDGAGKLFVSQAVDSLKIMLGRRWNAQWMAVGFPNGSLALPADPLHLLGAVAAYYRMHPEREVVSLGLTQARAEELRKAVQKARSAADAAREVEASAKLARDAAWRRLRARLRLLREELTASIGPDDPLWHSYGFRRPVDGQTPDMVDHVEVRPAAGGEVIAKWERARLAENYRVAWKLAGSSEEPTEVRLVNDFEVVISGLPAGREIEVLVSPRNWSGERKPTVAMCVVPGNVEANVPSAP